MQGTSLLPQTENENSAASQVVLISLSYDSILSYLSADSVISTISSKYARRLA